jgi:Brp/Blh family beta-carotene 15,15'-monooxygenase
MKTHLLQLSLLSILSIIGLSMPFEPIAGHVLFAASLFILGMPHGFADAVLIWNSDSCLRGVIEYFTIASIVAAIWLVSPLLVVCCFLLLTCFHWGVGDFLERNLSTQQLTKLGISKGIILFAAVFSFQTKESCQILEMLGYLPSLELSRIIAAVLFALALPFHLFHLFHSDLKNKKMRVIEVVLLFCLTASTPAFLAIMSYYVICHCPRHFLNLTKNKNQAVSKKAIGLTHLLCTFMFGIPILAYSLFHQHSFAQLSQVQLMIIMFLTLPHAILAWKTQVPLKGSSLRPQNSGAWKSLKLHSKTP